MLTTNTNSKLGKCTDTFATLHRPPNSHLPFGDSTRLKNVQYGRRRKSKKEEVKVKEKDLFNIRVDVKFNKETLSVLEQKAASFGLNKSQYIRKLVTSDARTKRVFQKMK